MTDAPQSPKIRTVSYGTALVALIILTISSMAAMIIVSHHRWNEGYRKGMTTGLALNLKGQLSDIKDCVHGHKLEACQDACKKGLGFLCGFDPAKTEVLPPDIDPMNDLLTEPVVDEIRKQARETAKRRIKDLAHKLEAVDDASDAHRN